MTKLFGISSHKTMLGLSKDFRYLLFVGSGRTGSTLVGQLLNNHPEILITNESRVLQKCVAENKKLSQHIPSLIRESMQTFLHGTHQYDRVGQDNQRKVWQRDWVDTSKLERVPKQHIKLVGDKKQGGNTTTILQGESAVLEAVDMKFVPISVVRDPKQVFKSYVKLNSDLEKSANIVIRDMTAGYDFVRRHDGIIVRYENLLSDPKQWCGQVCDILGVSRCSRWSELVEQTVSSNKKPHELSKEESDFLLKDPRFNELARKVEDYDL